MIKVIFRPKDIHQTVHSSNQSGKSSLILPISRTLWKCGHNYVKRSITSKYNLHAEQVKFDKAKIILLIYYI